MCTIAPRQRSTVWRIASLLIFDVPGLFVESMIGCSPSKRPILVVRDFPEEVFRVFSPLTSE
jgi:hypothetical protein